MTFLFPGFLIAAGLVSLGVVILHFIVTQQPKSETLPTVRFVPDIPARSTSVAIRPSDLLLLLVRVAMIMLIGAAFAQPQLKPKHQRVARLVMVDASRAVANPHELADSARHYAAGASAVVLFDSVSHEVAANAVQDSLQAIASRNHLTRRGLLSPALITTLRAATRVRDAADSLDLVVVSPFANEERDAATESIRALWPGHIHVVHVAAATDSAVNAQSSVQHPKIEWADSASSAGATTFWATRPRIDTVGAVRAGAAVLVYPFVRRWRPATAPDSETHVYARWVDGEPAAFERIHDGTCERSIAIPIPTEGDAILRPDFVRFLDGLSAPCGTLHDLGPLPDEFLSAFQGPASLAVATAIKPPVTHMTPLVPWLLAAALFLALLELLVRRPWEKREAEQLDRSDANRTTRTSPTGRAA